jgi:hypothetical protein
MKTSTFNTKNKIKRILFFIILLAISFPSFSQNKLATIESSVNFTILIPIICVGSLAIFLFTAFLKQKNN